MKFIFKDCGDTNTYIQLDKRTQLLKISKTFQEYFL